MFKIIAAFAFVAACAADSPPYPPQQAYKQQENYDEPAKYNFNWVVKDDPSYNNFGQQEQRDGYNTDGSYFVQLPDSRVQSVKYYVNGDSGYVAEVNYSGEPKYEAAAPSYQKPSYAPAPAPAAYKPQQDPYKAAPPAYKPAPAAYKPAPAVPSYKPAPAPYAPSKPAYAPPRTY